MSCVCSDSEIDLVGLTFSRSNRLASCKSMNDGFFLINSGTIDIVWVSAESTNMTDTDEYCIDVYQFIYLLYWLCVYILLF